MAHIFRVGENGARFLKHLGRGKKWLCQVWGQGEHMCNIDNSPNTSLSPFCLNSNSIQMNPKPFGNLNHHMNLQHLAPCQVWKSNDKEKLHDDYKNCSWAVTLQVRVLPFQRRVHQIFDMATWRDPTRIYTRKLSIKELRLRVKALTSTPMPDPFKF